MNEPSLIPWNRYALIAELAKQVDKTSNGHLGKTALQKMLFFLKEFYAVDCGYSFTIYTYGPFDSQILADLDMVENMGCVTVENLVSSTGGYTIRPTQNVDKLHGKADLFFEKNNVTSHISKMLTKYGTMNAREWELYATIVYIDKDLQRKKESSGKEEIWKLFHDIKPKFPREEFDRAVEELHKNQHLSCA